MNADHLYVGCYVGDCDENRGGKSHNYIYVCSYGPPSMRSGDGYMMSNQNFLSLCANEPAQWRSCNETLEEECDIKRPLNWKETDYYSHLKEIQKQLKSDGVPRSRLFGQFVKVFCTQEIVWFAYYCLKYGWQ